MCIKENIPLATAWGLTPVEIMRRIGAIERLGKGTKKRPPTVAEKVRFVEA
jgi:hypothetical protein